jgi:hypothetical protein
VLNDLLAHPRSSIPHRNEHAVTAGQFVWQLGAVAADISRLDQESTALRHRVACVDGVQKRRFDLIDIDHDRPELARQGPPSVD